MKKNIKQTVALVLSILTVLYILPWNAFSQYGMENVPLEHGKVLDCFGWSYNNVKAKASVIAESGYKSVMISPLQSTETDTKNLSFADWGEMYNSTSYDFGNSALGIQSEFSDMCKELDEYGISIIVQIVVKDSITEESGWDLEGFICATVAHGADGIYLIGAENLTVADGYWSGLISNVNRYAAQFYGAGKTIQFYAELSNEAIAQFAEMGIRAVSDYGISLLKSSVLEQSDVILAESYDVSYVHRVDSRKEYMSNVTNTAAVGDVSKAWAMLASRKDCMTVYFARPESTEAALGTACNVGWNSTEVAEINNLANFFEGADEQYNIYVNETSKHVVIERGTDGVVIIKVKGSGNSVSLSVKAIDLGNYTDQITGNTFTVSLGAVRGNIGNTGIAVVYNPIPKCSHASHDINGICKDCGVNVEHSYVNGACSCGAAEPISANYKVYYDTSTNAWSTVYAYAWTDSLDKMLGPWPGTEMTLLGDFIYEISVSDKAQNIIFSYNGSNQSADLILEPCGVYSGSSVVGYRHDFSRKICSEATKVPNSTVTEGAEYYYTCANNCGTVSTDKTFIADELCEHSLTYIAEVTGSCLVQGTRAHWACDSCGELFTDEAGKTVVSLEQLKYYGDHTFDGSGVCTLCGALSSKNYVYISAEHLWPSSEYHYAVWSWSEANYIEAVWVAPDKNASVDGYVAFCVEKDCEMIIFAAFPVGSGIDWSNRKYQTQNLTVDTANMYYTLRENKSESSGWSVGTWTQTPCVHSWENLDLGKYNCRSEHDEEYKCSSCGLSYYKVVHATDHTKPTDEALITVLSPADCQNDGEVLYTCAKCNATVTETVSKTEHIYDENGFCIYCDTAEPAEDRDGDSYCEIYNEGNLLWYAENIDINIYRNARLMADLDLSVVCGPDKGDWIGIGSEELPYRYSFDGNGHIIENVWIDAETDGYKGFFGYVNGANVKNLTVKGNISNGTVDAEGNSVGGAGGLVGYSGKVTITACGFEGSVYGSSCAGGLAGAGICDIYHSFSIANVSSDGDNDTGGILGRSETCYIKYSYFAGSATAGGEGTNYISGGSSCAYIGCLYLKGDYITDEAAGARTAEEFASGDVAYHLNNKKSDADAVWRQSLGTDPYPRPSGPIVYYGTTHNCDGTEIATFYSNEPIDESIPPHSVDEKGMCVVCGQRAAYLTVAVGDTVSYALTLSEAVAIAGTSDATITLIDSMGTLDAPVAGFGTVNCGNITFQLNGNDIVYNDTVFIDAQSGTVTFIGSGDIKRSENGTEGIVAFVGNGGDIKLKGGIFPSGVSYNKDILELTAEGYLFRDSDKWYNTEGLNTISGWTTVSYQSFTMSLLPYGKYAWVDVPTALSVEAQPINPEDTITYAWYQRGDSSTVLGTEPTLELTFSLAGIYTYYCEASCDGLTLTTQYATFIVDECPHTSYTNGFCDVCGDYQPAELLDGVYQIANSGNLFWFAALVNNDSTHADFDTQNTSANAVLTADIDLENRTWTPIESYLGSFDGAGHTIKGLYIVAVRSGSDLGFFSKITSPAVIKNFTVEGSIHADVMGKSPATVGVVAASGEDNMANGGTVSGITSKIKIISTAGISIKHVGGVVGAMYGGTVEKCIFDGAVSYNGATFTELGGVVGYAQKGTITLCANMAKLSSATHTGGILGYMNKEDTNVTNCYNYGTVSGRSGQYVGAIVGRVRAHGTITDNYYNSEATANAYGTGSEGDMTAVTAIAVTAQQFTSGYLAWTMNGNADNGLWKQNIDGTALPCFTGEGVYRHIDILRCDGEVIAYSFENTEQTDTSDIAVAPHGYTADGVCSYCGNIAYATVTIDGTVAYFEDLLEAFKYAQNSTAELPATIKILKDTELVEPITLESGNITLDLNGKCILCDLLYSSDYAIKLKCESFTITDTSSEMNGELRLSENEQIFELIVVEEATKLYLNAGNIYGRSDYGISLYGGSLEQNGGKISVKYAVNVSGPATYTVNNGEIEADYAVHVYESSGTVNIYGGSFTSAVIVLASVSPDSNISIYGGSFSFNQETTVVGYETSCICLLEDANTRIYGGDFVDGIMIDASLSNSYGCLMDVLADGYVFRDAKGEVIRLAENQIEILEPCTVSECEIVLEITWGALAFTYQCDSWDTETLTYSGEWICDEGANEITVELKCQCEVTVTVEYAAVDAAVSATVTDANGIEADSVTVHAFSKETLYISLTGYPSKNMEKEVIGTVKLTVGG